MRALFLACRWPPSPCILTGWGCGGRRRQGASSGPFIPLVEHSSHHGGSKGPASRHHHRGDSVPREFCEATDTLSMAPSRAHSEMSVSQTFHHGGSGEGRSSARVGTRSGEMLWVEGGVSLFSCRTAPPGHAGMDGRQADTQWVPVSTFPPENP